MNKAKRLVYTANFVALGVLFPLFTTHIIGISGSILSPMHIPVLLCGFMCGWTSGGICGLLSPLLSTLITGMPPAYPMMPMMMAELGVYGVMSGLLFGKFGLSVFVSLPIAMVAGRIVFGFMLVILTSLPISLMPASIWSSAVTGLPGIIIHLILIPVIIISLKIKPQKKEKATEEEK